MKAFIEAQVHSGLYSSASDYVRTLIRADQCRQGEARLNATLLDSAASEDVAGTAALCAWLHNRLPPGSSADHAVSK
jgi:putative addiction module CopG family antidote